MDWFVAGIISSLLIAVRSDINRRYKLNGLHLNFWQGLFLTLLVMPITFYVEWPDFGSVFYVIAAVTSMLVVVVMSVKNNLAAQYNGRVSNMEMPIKMFLLYFFWLLVDDASFQQAINNLDQTFGALCMLILASYAMNKMRRNDTGWHIFVQIVPIAFLAGVGDGLTKFAMVEHGGSLFSAIFLFIFLTQMGSAIISGLIIYFMPYFLRNGEVLPKVIVPNMIKASFMMAVISCAMVTAFFFSLAMSPNPAYVTALGMLVPIWLLIYHKVRDIPDDASPYMGTLLVLSALGLLLVTS